MTYSGVVHNDIGDTVFGAHLLGEPLDGVGVGDVEGVRMSHPAPRHDRGGSFLHARFIDVADHQFGSQPGEFEGGRATDTAAGAGDGNQRVAELFARTAGLRT